MKWHEKPINVIIVTILFWPLGVYYMWLNKMFFFKNTTEEPEESKASGDVAPSDEKRLQEKQEENVEIDDELDEDDPSDEKRLQEKQEEVVEIDGEDKKCSHIIGRGENEEIVATARLFDNNDNEGRHQRFWAHRQGGIEMHIK